MPLCVWRLTVIARFHVAGSNCLSCEHKREVFGKHGRGGTVEEECCEGTVQRGRGKEQAMTEKNEYSGKKNSCRVWEGNVSLLCYSLEISKRHAVRDFQLCFVLFCFTSFHSPPRHPTMWGKWI